MGLSGSYAPNIPDKVHTDLMDAQRRKMLESLDSLKKDEKTREYADLIEIMTTMWCDPSRKAGSCWGDDITDVRLEYRRFRVNAEGNKVEGTESNWSMCQIMTLGNNFNDMRTVVPAEKFKLVVADDDGSNKRLKNLKDITEQAKEIFPGEDLGDDTNLGVKEVAVAYRMAFVPIPKADSGWQCEVRYVCYGYNTMTASKPKNVLLFGDTMNASMFEEEPGNEVGFQPIYTKVKSPFDPLTGNSDEEKMRCFATSVEATDRVVADIGTETKAQSAAAAAAGKGTQVKTGCEWDIGTSSGAWHVAVPLEEAPDPAHKYRNLGGGANMGNSSKYVSCSSSGGDEPAFRSLSATDDDGESVFRSAFSPEALEAARAGEQLTGTAHEGRIGIGTYVCDARPLPHKAPVAKSTPAIATSINIMTVDMGVAPDTQSVLDAAKFLHQRHKLTANQGKEIKSRASEEAVKAGLSTDAPHSTKVLNQLEKTVGAQMTKAIAKENKRQMIAAGRPLFAGVPEE
jgi:hypothetical protein